MKTVTIFRHAKSSWAEPECDDFDRPLNERGWKSARRMGRELKHRKIGFDLCLASPAARVRETLDGLGETYGDFPFPVRFEPEVYLADTATLLELVSSVADDVGRLLIVGHNPGLERLVATLAHDDGTGLRGRVAEKFPTAALAVIELPVTHWSQVAPGSGKLVELILPKELD